MPAFWTLETIDPSYGPAWTALKRAGPTVNVVVFGENYAAATASVLADATRTQAERDDWLAKHTARIDEQPSFVLGYVSTRDVQPDPTDPTRMIYPLRPIDVITGVKAPPSMNYASVKTWYDLFKGHIDGIYFDELVLPEVPASIAEAQAVIAEFRKTHPRTAADARLMILAGQCEDPYVAQFDVDWSVLWEGRIAKDPVRNKLDEPYRESFTARLEDPSQPPPLRRIPSWWKDPAVRHKIVHVIHNCPESSRQEALSLANERNAGNVFIMDRRGGAAGDLYDHLPPYWDEEVTEVDSYLDFGFDPLRALTAAGRYGASQSGILHAWPNYEARWSRAGHVRGTYLLHSGVPGITRVSLWLADLPSDVQGKPPLHDIPRVWHAAHRYARTTLGMQTAIPIFEPDPGFGLIAFGASVVQSVQVPLTGSGGTYQHPTFAEPGWVIRNVNRVTGVPTFCTFEPDNPNKPQGVETHFNCYTVSAQHVTWKDVLTDTYIAQL